MNSSSKRPTTRRHLYAFSQAGVGLIEILIAVLVLGIGMLGIAAMQAMALRNSQSSLERSLAVIQSYSILDAMRANRERAISGDYDISLSTACSTPGNSTLAQRDIGKWYESLEALLGDGACGGIVRQGDKVVVTVRWNDSRGMEGEEDQAVVTSTQL